MSQFFERGAAGVADEETGSGAAKGERGGISHPVRMAETPAGIEAVARASALLRAGAIRPSLDDAAKRSIAHREAAMVDDYAADPETQAEVVRLSQGTDLSRPTFARQFKQHSGRSFSEFLNRLRLDAACRELAASDRSVIDIALASGFSQISFFNRLFRRELKCSPSEYRAGYVAAKSPGSPG